MVPALVSLYRESQTADRIRKAAPEAFARADFERGKSVSLAPELQSVLASQEPSVDWSKIKIRRGYNAPFSEATTIHDRISFKDPPSYAPGSPKFENTLFHEIAHVPQWKSGRLTFPRYIGEALGAALRFAPTTSATYGMHPAEKSPPKEGIWDLIPVESEAEKHGKTLQAAYRAAYPDARTRRLFK